MMRIQGSTIRRQVSEWKGKAKEMDAEGRKWILIRIVMQGVGTRSSILSPILPDLLELGSSTNIVEGFIMNENEEKN